MILRTVAQLVKSPPPEPALGRRLYRPTSQVVFPSPVLGYQRRFRRTEIHMIRGETCIVRPYKVPRDPKTPTQLARRTAMGKAKGTWHLLPKEARDAWGAFARAQVFPDGNTTGRTEALAGFNAYVRAQIYRQGMGEAPSLEPPRHAVPESVLAIEELPPPDADSFAFRVSHAMPATAGCALLFEITPAMPTLKRRPREQELRWAGATDAESFLPLAPDGSVYLLPRARFAVEPGLRYAVRARILSPDSLPGRELMVSLVRLAPEPEAWTAARAVLEESASCPPALQDGEARAGSIGSQARLDGPAPGPRPRTPGLQQTVKRVMDEGTSPPGLSRWYGD